MCAEMFRHEAGIDMNLIPYKGTSQLVTDLVGGHVQASFAAITPSFGNIKAGNVRALAVDQPEALVAAAGTLPTVSESGLPGFASDAQFTACWRRPARRRRSSTRSTRRCGSRSPTKTCASASAPRRRSGVEHAGEYGAIVDRDMARWSALDQENSI